mgnify:CR=1 FL=1
MDYTKTLSTRNHKCNLAPKYDVITSREEIRKVFLDLSRNLSIELKKISSKSQSLLLECGHLTNHLRYIFVKQNSKKGWLFEESSSGWNIAGGEKIIGSDTFTRSKEFIDKVRVYYPLTKGAQKRVRSPAFSNDEVVSFREYITIMCNHLKNNLEK